LNECILLPDIGAALRVVSLKPSLVRLGIEAPPDLTILREEVYLRASRHGTAAPPPAPARADRSVGDRLRRVARRVALLRRQLAVGPAVPTGTALAALDDELRALHEQIGEVLGEAAGEPAILPGLPGALASRMSSML
jgi:sRNA-binding carbon storage regulator CsrA